MTETVMNTHGFGSHSHSAECVGVEVPGVWDGVLYWACSDGEFRNPWEEALNGPGRNSLAMRRYKAAAEQIKAQTAHTGEVAEDTLTLPSSGELALNKLILRIKKINTANGWYDTTPSFGDEVALLHSEASEMLEDFRDHRGINEVYYRHNKSCPASPGAECPIDSAVCCCIPKPCGIPCEVADLIIRALDTVGRHGIDLEWALNAVLEHNEMRGYRHGGKAL